jgi:hypothetical protein
LLALALGTSACGRGCTCISGEKTYETVHGKYEVSLVRKTHWTGGKLPGPISNFYVHVETSPPIDESIGDCTHADMKEDKDGKFVGFRCQDTHEKEWTVLRLRGGDRHLRECQAPVGTDDTPDWKKLESVRASTSRILGCHDSDHFVVLRELAHAVLEDEGSAVAGDYVMTLASLEPLRQPESWQSPWVSNDPWESALDILDPPARAAALAKLCPTLARADGKAEPESYVRASRLCPLDPSGALATFRALLATQGANGYAANAALYWSGLLAAKKDPKATGAALCEALPAMTSSNEERANLAFELLGQTHTKCPALARSLEPPPCGSILDCDGGLCSDLELAEDLAGWDSELDGGRRNDPKFPQRERALLRAAYAAGPLPKEITLPNQRRLYARADAGDLPYCSDSTLDAGAECQTTIRYDEECAVAVNENVLEQSDCTIHIDDAHRRFDVPHRVCERLGADCSKHPCCGNAMCKGDRCVERPAPDAGPSDAGRD